VDSTPTASWLTAHNFGTAGAGTFTARSTTLGGGCCQAAVAPEMTRTPSDASTADSVASGASDGYRVGVKNTFIDVSDDEDEYDASDLRARGARTCSARLSRAGSWQFEDDEDGFETEHGGIGFISSSSSDGSLGQSAVQTESFTTSFKVETHPVPAAPVMAPHQVRELQELRRARAMAPCLVAIPAPLAGVTTVGQLQVGVAPVISIGNCLQPYFATFGPQVQKSDMVCCHWKNKGWCRYQDSCKFQHPEHKRGVGHLVKAAPSVSGRSAAASRAKM